MNPSSSDTVGFTLWKALDSPAYHCCQNMTRHFLGAGSAAQPNGQTTCDGTDKSRAGFHQTTLANNQIYTSLFLQSLLVARFVRTFVLDRRLYL
jgi:hypothetical protein